MKKLIIFTLIAATGLPVIGFSQLHAGKITGAVAVNNALKMEFPATAVLMTAKDSLVKSRNITDSTGTFIFEDVVPGKYLVVISAVNYQSACITIPEITETRSNIYLKTTRLSPISGMLENVIVSAKKPFIQQKAGMMIINVGASPVNTGLTALELLEKSPGISVSNDGKISLKGKQGVTILIDGKPTYMSEADLAALLKSMQSSSIETIEIMTNPSAKYDAAGNSGIINIRTKKGSVKGMNGTANIGYSQGIYARLNGGVNLNYRNNKLNIFGGYSRSNAERANSLTINRNFYNDDKHTLTGSADQESRIYSNNIYQNLKAGIDYYISKKDVAGITLNGSLIESKDIPESDINVRDENTNLLYRLRSDNKSTRHSDNIAANFNYKHSFDTTGRELTADLDYAFYDNNNSSELVSQAYNADNTLNGEALLLNGKIPSDINIYSAKMDYVYPFKHGLKLEAGVKTSLVKTDNQVAYLRNSGHGWAADDRSNHFIYNENINAGYLILTRNIKKWEFSAGLRAENTNSKGHQFKNDSVFRRNYTSLFPNIGLKYEAGKKNDLNLSFSRRILRPDYNALNPFIFFLDSLTYQQGNPYLQPQFTNNIEFSHTYNKFLTTTLNYTRTNDVITVLLKQDTENKLTYQTADNLSSMQQFGIAMSVNTALNKWWNTNVFVNVYNNRFKGLYQNDPVKIQITSVSLNISNNFTLGKGWNAEVSGRFNSRAGDGLLIGSNMGSLNAGISKQVMKDKGSFKVGIRDIFRTDQFNGYARYSDVDVRLRSVRDNRQVSLAFNYRFGKKNIASARKKSTGALDEQNRVKN